MSIISASTLITTALSYTADTTGTLVFKTGATPTTAMTIGSDQSVTFAGATVYTGLAVFGSGSTLGGATNPIVAMTGAANNYIQSYIYNNTNGVNSSADFVAYANNSTDSSGWVDMGYTSASYAQAAYSVTGPNEAYIFASAPSGASKTGNLVLATDATGTANAIQFYTNGFTKAKSAAAMQIDSSGNVSIGITSAGAKLDVFGTPSASGSMGLRISDGGRVALFQVTGASYSYNGVGGQEVLLYGAGGPLNLLADGQPIKFLAGSSEKMRIDTSGRVMIGTSTSASNFLVLKNGTSTTANTLFGGGSCAALIGSEVGLIVSSNIVAATGLPSATETAKGGINFTYFSSTNPTEFCLGIDGTPTVASNVRFYNNGVERMRISSTGDVGIGGTAGYIVSGRKLSVEQPSGTYGQNNAIQRWAYATKGVIDLYMDGSVNPIFNTDPESYWAPTATMIWQYRGTERMRIASNGYIGIGTSAPTGQIDVNRGTVGIRCPNAAGAAVQFAGGKTGSGSTVTGTMLTVNFSAVSYFACTLHVFSTCYQLNGGGSANSAMIGAYDIVNILRQSSTSITYNITRVSGPSLTAGISATWTVTGGIASNVFTLTGSSPSAGQTGWTFTGYMVYGGQGSSPTNVILTSYDDGTAQVWGA